MLFDAVAVDARSYSIRVRTSNFNFARFVDTHLFGPIVDQSCTAAVALAPPPSSSTAMATTTTMQAHTAELNGITLGWREYGAATSTTLVVLCHGWPGMYDTVAAASFMLKLLCGHILRHWLQLATPSTCTCYGWLSCSSSRHAWLRC